MNLPSYQDYYIKSIVDVDLSTFDCDTALLSFFQNDAIDSEEELITKTYFLFNENIPEPLVGFSLSNNIVEATNEINMTIISGAQYNVYPAVLLGRLATHSKHLGQGFASIAMAIIKSWFITESKTGCRFIIVDSRPEAERFYIEKAGFERFPEQRKNSKTILLYFDLKAFEIGLPKN